MTTFTRRKKISFLWIVSGEALTFLLVVAASSSAQVTTPRPPTVLPPPFTANKGELLQKLRDRKFQDLDAQLKSYQTRFEQEALAEGNLAVAFEAFCSPDPALSPLLDQWVAKDPNSYPAHLARAEYLVTAGYQARGDQSADETSAGQFAEMNVLLGKAVKDAGVAIKLNPKSGLAYAAIIDAARGASDDDMREKVFAAGLKNVPLSMTIRVSEIRALQPRWGGSYGAMERLAADAQKYAAQNPKLVTLKGFADVERGRVALMDNDTEGAIRFYDQALQQGGDLFNSGYTSRGILFLRLGRYDDALQDLNRANHLRPQEPRVLESLAYIYAHFKRPKDTLAMIQEYRTFAEPGSGLVNLELWAQNFNPGAVPGAGKGGD
jgi:tetratricopeptide (TPR) repeat protein